MSSPSMDFLIKALLDGDQAEALAETSRLRDAGIGCGRIVSEGIGAAMTLPDAKCTVEQFNLPEIMLAGRAVMGVIKELYPPADPPLRTKGTVVVGALEGDVHDLGKNVITSILTAQRYRVVDRGRDCPVETLIDTAERELGHIILLEAESAQLLSRFEQRGGCILSSCCEIPPEAKPEKVATMV